MTTSPSSWSVIVRAQGSGPEARAAMGALIGCHQGTVLSLIRQRGFPPDQTAEDLKQAFFARMLQRNDVARLDQERGHFRGWLKTAVYRFLINDWKRWYRTAGTTREPLEEDATAADVVDKDVFDIAYAWDIYRPAFEALREEQRDLARFEAVK
ncbi:MAG TPA: sigma factor, partial [Polyangia bacterium]